MKTPFLLRVVNPEKHHKQETEPSHCVAAPCFLQKKRMGYQIFGKKKTPTEYILITNNLAIKRICPRDVGAPNLRGEVGGAVKLEGLVAAGYAGGAGDDQVGGFLFGVVEVVGHVEWDTTYDVALLVVEMAHKEKGHIIGYHRVQQFVILLLRQVGGWRGAVVVAVAEEAGVDLVKIAPNAAPPVCRIIDYGKFRYEQMRKEKEARKKQKIVELKEIRLSPNIESNDLNTKISAAKKFICKGDKVKVTLRFRGREMAHMASSKHILDDFAAALEDVAVVEKPAKVEGRSMTLVLAEKKN